MPPAVVVRPLVVTADPDLLDDLLRLAAAAGVEPEVAGQPGAARPAWPLAPLVLVGADAADALASAQLPRRASVLLVARDPEDPAVWQAAVALGAEQVVFLPEAQTWLVNRFADAAEGSAADGRCVCVIGGRGGAGASTLAAALAWTGAALGSPTLLVDADPLGGGLDLVLGGESVAGVRWPDLVGTRGRLSARALHDALPRINGLAVLSWERSGELTLPPEALHAVLDAGLRGSRLVVVDLPRTLNEAVARALGRADVTLVVVPAEVRAAAAAARVAAAVRAHARDVRVVVRGPAPSGLPAQAVADSVGLPLAAALRPEPGLAPALERGDPPAGRGRGPLAEFCRRFVSELPGPGASDVRSHAA